MPIHKISESPPKSVGRLNLSQGVRSSSDALFTLTPLLTKSPSSPPPPPPSQPAPQIPPKDIETPPRPATSKVSPVLYESPVSSVSEDGSFHYNLSSAGGAEEAEKIGLGCLPVQKRLQALRKGVNFTIILVGESGVGKTSFVNTLFDSLLIESGGGNKPSAGLTKADLSLHPPTGESFERKTTRIVPYKMDLVENNFNMHCTVLDTPGFGDYIDNKYCWYPITRYIDEQYRMLVYQEQQPDRTQIAHHEVHVCLYFIKPTATGLSALDVESMKNLAPRVNLIPVISKADGFTAEELRSFKLKIQETLVANNIEVCQFTKESKGAADLIDEMPFSIINSIERHKNAEGKVVRARKFSWGLAEVENPAHCDFIKLRSFLLGSHLGDLITSTENYYENYRRDFMTFRLNLSVQKVLNTEELADLGLEVESCQPEKEDDDDFDGTGSQRTKHSWKWSTLREAKVGASPSRVPSESVKKLTETQTAISVLKLIERSSLTATEKELVLLNPAYLDLEKYVKSKFKADVKRENQRFKEWKKQLFLKQEKFNDDIDKIHERVQLLQAEVKELVRPPPSETAVEAGLEPSTEVK